MAQLTGMAVTLTTADNEDAGTDDQLYIGVVGTAGGREFPLDSGDSPFKSGETGKFALGDIWEGGFVDSNTKFPLRSGVGEDNDPALIPLEIERVFFVYLRKQGDNTSDDDNAYLLEELRVALYGPAAPSKRVYRFFNGENDVPLWLGNEHGHVVYLQEIREG